MILFDDEKRSNDNTVSEDKNTESMQLYLLKAYSYFLDPKSRCKLQCIIKIIELRECMNELKTIESDISNGKKYEFKPLSPDEFIRTLKDELPKDKQEAMQSVMDMFETMQLYQEMMSMKADT